VRCVNVGNTSVGVQVRGCVCSLATDITHTQTHTYTRTVVLDRIYIILCGYFERNPPANIKRPLWQRNGNY